jgi:hypothetical protein
MYCETPDFNEFGHIFNSSNRQISVDYGFIMDGVQNLRIVRDSIICRSEPFRYMPDPKILAFSSIIQYKEGMMLEIMVSTILLHSHNSNAVCCVNEALEEKTSGTKCLIIT